MADPKERVVEWLRDSHATREQAHSMLTKTAQQTESLPEYRAGLQRQGELASEQARRIKACLEQLGEGTSVIKTVTGQISALTQTMSGYVVHDEPIKALLAIATFSQMQATSYRILVAGAQLAGLHSVETLCRELLTEEQEFAEWTTQQAEPVTRYYLTAQHSEA